jgi:hypothetical protein
MVGRAGGGGHGGGGGGEVMRHHIVVDIYFSAHFLHPPTNLNQVEPLSAATLRFAQIYKTENALKKSLFKLEQVWRVVAPC